MRESDCLDFRGVKTRETSRDARFLTHLSIETRRIMRAAGEMAVLKSLQNETLLLKTRVWYSQLSDLVYGAQFLPRFELDVVGEEKKREKNRKKRETRQFLSAF